MNSKLYSEVKALLRANGVKGTKAGSKTLRRVLKGESTATPRMLAEKIMELADTKPSKNGKQYLDKHHVAKAAKIGIV